MVTVGPTGWDGCDNDALPGLPSISITMGKFCECVNTPAIDGMTMHANKRVVDIAMEKRIRPKNI
jgi:hypothetical protein